MLKTGSAVMSAAINKVRDESTLQVNMFGDFVVKAKEHLSAFENDEAYLTKTFSQLAELFE